MLVDSEESLVDDPAEAILLLKKNRDHDGASLLATSLGREHISVAGVSTETVGRSRFHERDRCFAVYRWRGETIGRLGNSSVNSAAPLVNSI